MEVLFILAALTVIVVLIGNFVVVCLGSARPVSIFGEEAKTKTVGFWRRQFQIESTHNQRVFDWVVGVILPVICFTFDPIVFGEGNHEGILSFAKPFAYLLSFVSVMAMMAWLIWGKKLKGLNGILAGLFAVGGLISLGVGIILLPFSLLGLLFLIGALGLTPLFTSIVFLRNAARAYNSAEPFFIGRELLATAVLAAMFSIVVPFTINMEIKRLIDQMINGDVATIQRNTKILKFVAPITNFGKLIGNYSPADSPEKKQAMNDAIWELVGENEGSGFLLD